MGIVGETMIFVMDTATGNVKLITELSGTTQFLKHLGLLYDSFGISVRELFPRTTATANGEKGALIRHLSQSNSFQVKEVNNLKERATTNGPQGTVSQKTQQCAQLLLRGVNRLLENINTINREIANTSIGVYCP